MATNPAVTFFLPFAIMKNEQTMTQEQEGVTHYFLEALYCSKRRIHHQLRQIVHKSLGFRPNKR